MSASRKAKKPRPGRTGSRFVIAVLHKGYVRNYERTLRLLLERGHHVHLAVLRPSKQAQHRIAEGLVGEYPTFTMSDSRRPERGGRTNLRWALLVLADHARYLHPRYRGSTALRERVVGKALGGRKTAGPVLAGFLTVWVHTVGRLSNAWLSEHLVRTFLWLADALPASDAVERYLANLKPDVVLSTPHVAIGSPEAEYLRAAERHGWRNGLLVASWDNLTNKGLVKVHPQKVFVWNEAQVQEATEMHGLAAETLVITGAQRFDEWFEQKPSWSHDSFMRQVGLRAEVPYVCYLCSSPFIAPDEVAFVQRLVAALRASGGSLADAGVLIRPHPQNAKQWASVDVTAWGNTTVWPRAGEQPVDAGSRSSFYDSIHHSAAVVGINTSAQIEAGIIGRTVHTVTDSSFRETQEGTLHFHHLLSENGGLLYEAGSIEELIPDLERAVDGVLDGGQTAAFVERFVRPLGLETPGSPVLADALEALATGPAPEPWSPARSMRIAAVLMRPIEWLSVPFELKRLGDALMRPVRALRERVRPAPVTKPPAPVDKTNLKRVRTDVRQILRSTGSQPLLVGPWTRDALTEQLYWIPFLRWLTHAFQLDPAQLIAVSRGGTASWYGGVCDGYLEIMDVAADAEIEALRNTGSAQLRQSETLQLAILAAARRRTGSERIGVLPPSLLDTLFRRYWSDRGGVREVLRSVDLRPYRVPTDDRLERRLPAEYFAVHFSFGPSLADTRENRAVLDRTIAALAEVAPVVVLGPAPDGGTFHEPDLSRRGVLRLVEDLAPANSLHAQTVALNHARGFVGTFGALSTLALFTQAPSVTLFAPPDPLTGAHVDFAERVATALDVPSLVVDVAGLDILLGASGARAASGSTPLVPQRPRDTAT